MPERSLALPDVNVLVALTNSAHVFHAEAHTWLSGVARFATTPVTESGLVRMLMNPVVTGQDVSPERAVAVLAGVRADNRAVFLADDSSLADTALDIAGILGHRQVTDWHLLNLAARHSGVLVTFDRKIVRSLTAADRGLVTTLPPSGVS